MREEAQAKKNMNIGSARKGNNTGAVFACRKQDLCDGKLAG